ncbi:glycosyltransferase [Candidatus Venteria ishoeyi]|uniref:Poly-beta-1,6-N-acetyl-D-glucosamine synthase n=1 Tax=Candidatus Venteria ishoeyi TaxID=1899563 RepID=A0A1H6F554_9GAMM|nr:glycosyltransferase [Candidatus Venteria ishoeyi]SEH05288.1 Poly-beta-1%2C6-N-acetyl-D-glucosamine synthase [Candidatus Venteria ishoeyi]
MKTNNQITDKTLFIIPCYNEEFRLKTESFLQFESNNSNIHFLFVDDGSQDRTSLVIGDLCSKMKNSNSLILTKNVGKAEAIRSGVLILKDDIKDYEFIGYLDADLSVPLEEINNFLTEIEKNKNIKFLMGIRVARLGANIDRKRSRHYLGRVFATVVSILLRKPVYDTQCGVKLIQSSLITQLFQEKFISKWLFDVELIIRWKIFYPEYDDMIFEQPLKKWTEVAGSKLKLINFLYAPIELFKIWITYRKYLKNDLPTKRKRH